VLVEKGHESGMLARFFQAKGYKGSPGGLKNGVVRAGHRVLVQAAGGKHFGRGEPLFRDFQPVLCQFRWS